VSPVRTAGAAELDPVRLLLIAAIVAIAPAVRAEPQVVSLGEVDKIEELSLEQRLDKPTPAPGSTSARARTARARARRIRLPISQPDPPL